MEKYLSDGMLHERIEAPNFFVYEIPDATLYEQYMSKNCEDVTASVLRKRPID